MVILQPGPHGIFEHGLLRIVRWFATLIVLSATNKNTDVAPCLKCGFRLGLIMMDIYVIWDLERLVTIFTAPSQQWNYDHSGPEIRSGRTHCGREWLRSLFKSRPVSIPVWCIAWLKILSSAITHICSLCQINRQLIRKRNNSKWASASWTTVSLS